MQIGILRMPPVGGVPLYRETAFSNNTLLRQVGVCMTFGDPPGDIVLGSNIIRTPEQLYKVVHVSHDSQYVFETVFSKEHHGTVCLYTKIIGTTIDTVISLPAIDFYKAHPEPLAPLSDIITDRYWRKSSVTSPQVFRTLTPPIFTKDTLDAYVADTVDVIEGVTHPWLLLERYKCIYQNEPSVLEALISGTFLKSPFNMVTMNHPQITLKEDKWSFQDLSLYKNRVTGGSIYYNQRDFDPVVMELISLRPASIAFTVLIHHAMDGLLELGVTRRMVDPYMNALGLSTAHFDSIKQSLRHIAVESIILYCRLYGIDPKCFGATREDKSSITIEKTMSDEISISFHDLVHDRYVSFYTCFPLMALGTMGVGRIIH